MTERRHDIDWLRIIAIVLVLYFHSGMAFIAEWDWHIQNEERSHLILEINFFLRQFRMPLLFLISGVGSWFAFRKRNIRRYIKERATRLLIPLIFAMLVIVPPQVYMERIFRGADYSSFFQFYPTIFTTGPYPDGNLSWHHMWFVLYLFLYSVIAAPLFFYLRLENGQNWRRILKKLAGKYTILSIPILAAIWYGSVCAYYPSTNALVNDGGFFVYWLSFFIAGYLIACNEEMWQTLRLNARFYLGIAVLFSLVVNYFRWNQLEPDTYNMLLYSIRFMTAMSGWMYIYAILGYGQKYLNKENKILSYSNRAIYPFYIVHQTIIVVLAYYIVQLEVEGVLFKYLFLSTLSLVLSILFYEFLVRPFKVSRYLFGVK
jgi:peptidoglycan/LPS O-acetylase OafA/YrhL